MEWITKQIGLIIIIHKFSVKLIGIVDGRHKD